MSFCFFAYMDHYCNINAYFFLQPNPVIYNKPPEFKDERDLQKEVTHILPTSFFFDVLVLPSILQITELPLIVVLECLDNFLTGVHHKRTVCHDGFAERFAAHYQHNRVVARLYGELFASVFE